MEAIGDITATCDVSRLEVSGLRFDSRIQGGVLADGLNGMIAGRRSSFIWPKISLIIYV